MKFYNDGARASAVAFRSLRYSGAPLIGSIAKSPKVPAGSIDEVIDDYQRSLRCLYEFFEAFEINISSPNSEALRSLQKGEFLRLLCTALVQCRNDLAGDCLRKQLLAKIDSDMPLADAHNLIQVLIEVGFDGVVVSNSTVDHSAVPAHMDTQGGLSGLPLRMQAEERVAKVALWAGRDLRVIAVGGIDGPEAAWRMLHAGADAVQVYTALPYEGALLVYWINYGLVQRMKGRGLRHVSQIKHWPSY